ncbi:unnamed protein product [Miscanthus lutarioriparius]|uniref:Uncharacterized protein n=1 Tax=Miscanthus lutarioriparius TaxID=422564 RepID=A0A811QDM4_9POAL|nr:unnamed protein product [Miscanthus lutarioriparius]
MGIGQIMEPAAAWDRPCEFQLANWTVEEPVADLPLPVEYASIDIPGDCGIQAYEYDVQQLLVEYYSAASRRISTSDARNVVNQVLDDFKAEMDMMEQKMHRYPTCLGAVDKSYTVPRIVAIGPYHHGLEHLKQAEKVKHVAACHCIGDVQLLEEMYEEFVPEADKARRFYDKDVIEGISYDDFRHMMFFDACFLVQYMAMRTSFTRRDIIDGSLQRFMRPNRSDIFHDVMLLENQLPWTVVDKVLSFMADHDPDGPSIPKKFVYRLRYCMKPDDHREPPEEEDSFNWDDEYTPPHLLGLLHYYIVGRRSNIDKEEDEEPKNLSFFVSAMDLAEIGITLKANKTMKLLDMHLNQKGAVFTELSLAPLSLDRDRASHLVSMAAFELCTIESFGAKSARDEDSAVCSYVMLLANLVYREEDVQELRERGLLQRGGLTNSEALAFFTSVQGLRFGPCYTRIMKQIKNYRDNSRMKTKLHAFVYYHKKTIAAVVTGIGAVGGIIGTLLSIKKSI